MDSENADRMFFELLAKSYAVYMSQDSSEPDNLQLEKELDLDFRELL